jgi:hypothetical protein
LYFGLELEATVDGALPRAARPSDRDYLGSTLGQSFAEAKRDHTVHPDRQRASAKRMGATTVELDSSHVPMPSQPDKVLDVIRAAAAAVASSASPPAAAAG